MYLGQLFLSIFISIIIKDTKNTDKKSGGT